MIRKPKSYFKFLSVGVINALVDLTILNALMLISPSKNSFDILLFNTIAVICAIVSSYYLNRFWTFSDRANGGLKEGFLFIIQAFINLGLNDTTTVIFSRFLIFSKDIPIFFGSNLSKGLAMLISSSCSYFFMKRIVFKKKKDEHSPLHYPDDIVQL
ncbi:GtrA family protein [Alicyclobacillus fodiniaquatilis]|uniref:GtrA family protein n=1 Tax=Alicyclobacillus fodiniaquatilis TaxID=1661150 RepID=A0ABW4JAD8_9BACL